MKIDFKLFTLVLVIIFVMTVITFMVKSVLIEIMLPILMVGIGLYAIYLLYKSLNGGQ